MTDMILHTTIWRAFFAFGDNEDTVLTVLARPTANLSPIDNVRHVPRENAHAAHHPLVADSIGKSSLFPGGYSSVATVRAAS